MASRKNEGRGKRHVRPLIRAEIADLKLRISVDSERVRAALPKDYVVTIDLEYCMLIL
jgi:hypothetical protein